MSQATATMCIRFLLGSVILASMSCGASDGTTSPGTLEHEAGANGDGAASSEGGSLVDNWKDAPACAPRTCTQLGATCGKAPDGCGGVVACGACSAGETCGGAGPNVCGGTSCLPKTCAQLGAACGLVSDGCSEVIDCGVCACDGGFAETCNGADDDCNGTVDDVGNVDQDCGSIHAGAGEVAGWVCAKGACVIGACAPGRLDCDGSPANGCESPGTQWTCPVSHDSYATSEACSAACVETADCGESCETSTTYYRVATGFREPCECAPADPADCEQNLCFSGTCDYSGSSAVSSPPAGAILIGSGCSGYQEGADYYRLEETTCTWSCPFAGSCDGAPPRCSRPRGCSEGPGC